MIIGMFDRVSVPFPFILISAIKTLRVEQQHHIRQARCFIAIDLNKQAPGYIEAKLDVPFALVDSLYSAVVAEFLERVIGGSQEFINVLHERARLPTF